MMVQHLRGLSRTNLSSWNMLIIVGNSALVAASHLFEQSTDNATIVRRWIGEVQEALIKKKSSRNNNRSNNDMVQMNAMRLLCQMKGNDRLGMAKLVQQYSAQAGKGITSPLALVILLRACDRLLSEELSQIGDVADHRDIREISPMCKLGFDFLESSLSHSDTMVSYEAARTLCTLPNLETQTHNLTRAIECFQRMLASDQPSARFAAVRTLSEVANIHPRAVARCNEALEGVLGDSNNHVATLAVTTLLKTGSEQSIERLVRNISSLISAVPDEFKITVVHSMQQLCLRYPMKHRVLVGFMAEFLREEGGFEFKRSIVDAIVSLTRMVPETADSSLLHLCEFIEDCEYTMLSTQTIHVIAELGPKALAPSRCIRFLYNRVILENAMVRAAAVSALTKFASSCPSLRMSIVSLLKHSCLDDDDEVRDRAVTAVKVLETAMESNPYVTPDADLSIEDAPPDVPAEEDMAALIYSELPFTFHRLEHSIKAYIATPGVMSNDLEQLTFSALPIIEDVNEEDDGTISGNYSSALNGLSKLDLGDDSLGDMKKIKKDRLDPAAAVYAVPELASLGRVFRSSAPIALTEDETEYVVRCVKHILDNHVVLQFIIQNTVEDQLMENVMVSVESDSELYEIIGDISAEKIKYGSAANCFTVLQRNEDKQIVPTGFVCQLNFTVVQVDSESGETLGDGYEEEYPLEDLIIVPSDYMAKVTAVDFRKAWNETSDSNEVLDKFLLQFKDLNKAVSSVIDLLGMSSCDGTGQLSKNTSGVKPHMLHLSGRFVGDKEVLVRAQLTPQSDGTLLKIAVRSSDPTVSRLVADCVM